MERFSKIIKKIKDFLKMRKTTEVDIYRAGKNKEKKLTTFTIIMIIIIILIVLAIICYAIDTRLRISKSEEFGKQIAQYIEEQQKNENQNQDQTKENTQNSNQKTENTQSLGKVPVLTEEGKKKFKKIYETKEKIAYLTFDDGPSNNTRKIIKILKKNDIKATFFVLGSQIKIFPETTKELYDQGHFIANHGYTHNYAKIYKKPQAVLDEFNQTNKLVAKTIGVPDYNSHLFRFPGGYYGGPYANVKSKAAKLLEKNQILNIDWNALNGDAETAYPSVNYLMKRIKSSTKGQKNLVILMHDAEAKKNTVKCLQNVIDYLKNKGYKFDNFYNIFK